MRICLTLAENYSEMKKMEINDLCELERLLIRKVNVCSTRGDDWGYNHYMALWKDLLAIKHVKESERKYG